MEYAKKPIVQEKFFPGNLQRKNGVIFISGIKESLVTAKHFPRKCIQLTEGTRTMNRRQMVLLPGTALLASEVFAQSQTEAPASRPSVPAGSLSPHKALKYSGKYGRAKYAYKIPKTPAKQEKYISFLSTLLSLTTAQQQQAASIFTAATAAKGALRTQVQAAHDALSDAVKTNNPTTINQASAAIGALGAQRRALGAQANASFYQILTAAQQSTLSQFQLKSV
jgi:Spy/CpxP family protein refolding chaperone